MKNTKKAFGQIFTVIDSGTYHPKDETWENLITKSKHRGYPSGTFNSGSKTIDGKIIGFHIPSNAQKNHPKFAFIKNNQGRFAIKFW